MDEFEKSFKEMTEKYANDISEGFTEKDAIKKLVTSELGRIFNSFWKPNTSAINAIANINNNAYEKINTAILESPILNGIINRRIEMIKYGIIPIFIKLDSLSDELKEKILLEIKEDAKR